MFISMWSTSWRHKFRELLLSGKLIRQYGIVYEVKERGSAETRSKRRFTKA